MGQEEAALLKAELLTAALVVAAETPVAAELPSVGWAEWVEVAAKADACRTPVTASTEIAMALPMTRLGPPELPAAVSGSYSREGVMPPVSLVQAN